MLAKPSNSPSCATVPGWKAFVETPPNARVTPLHGGRVTVAEHRDDHVRCTTNFPVPGDNLRVRHGRQGPMRAQLRQAIP